MPLLLRDYRLTFGAEHLSGEQMFNVHAHVLVRRLACHNRAAHE
jgi:hypothetical protein